MGIDRRFRCGGQGFDGVVGEDEPEAGAVGALEVDLELEGVIQLALDAFGRLGDVDAFQDRKRVEQADVLCRLLLRRPCQVV